MMTRGFNYDQFITRKLPEVVDLNSSTHYCEKKRDKKHKIKIFTKKQTITDKFKRINSVDAHT
jgi:hypothetical protein